MSPTTAMSLLALPPVRGAASLLFLLLLGGLAFSESDLRVWERGAIALGVILFGAPIWMVTCTGFLKHVRTATRGEDPTLLAWRPRRAAVVISWISLLGVVVGLPTFAMLIARDGAAVPLLVSLAAVVVGLPIATVLPRLSRWYALRQGTAWIDEAGLIVRSADEADEVRVPLRAVDGMHRTARLTDVLPDDAAALLGRGVRWRPGARAAVARWTGEGFVPTFSEVRRLGLDPGWSDDPRAELPTRLDRVVEALFWLWAFSVLIALTTGAVYAVVVAEAPWWILPVLGVAPLIGLIILVPRAWRVWRTGNRSVHLDADGWVDLLHGQGRIPWEHVERIDVHRRNVVLVSTQDAPPFRDRDLGNRLNAAVEKAQARSPVRIRSAGPGFREIGPHHLPYGPETGVHSLLRHAAVYGKKEIRRVES